jgi:dynactin-5
MLMILDKVSRKAVITGATNIVLGGKSVIQAGQSLLLLRANGRRTDNLGAVLRGDLRRSTAGQHVVISMGRYCSIGEGTIIRPPGKIYKGYVYLPSLCPSHPTSASPLGAGK